MINLILNHQKEIENLCNRLNVKRLEVFGSAAKGEFDPYQSDLDFLVEFEKPEVPPGLLTRYLSLAEELEKILGKKIDLITPQSIRNPYFREAVNSNRESVYAA